LLVFGAFILTMMEGARMKLVCSVLITFVFAQILLAQTHKAQFQTAQRAAELSSAAKGSPTMSYHIGAGDKLGITVEIGARSEKTYTVRADGSIDFLLAGGSVNAAGKTVEQLADAISRAITVERLPRVTVRIKEYVSHGVLVEGLVDLPGTHQIQRDSVPLFVIRAAAGVRPNAVLVEVGRANGDRESHLLSSRDTDDLLVSKGDRVKFRGSEESDHTGYFFLRVNVAEKRPLRSGLTLSKIAAETKFKIAAIGTYAADGNLKKREFNLKDIRRGIIADPFIGQGDIVSLR
jgi:protein involved in polysaccharide export with SLBB domain